MKIRKLIVANLALLVVAAVSLLAHAAALLAVFWRRPSR